MPSFVHLLIDSSNQQIFYDCHVLTFMFHLQQWNSTWLYENGKSRREFHWHVPTSRLVWNLSTSKPMFNSETNQSFNKDQINHAKVNWKFTDEKLASQERAKYFQTDTSGWSIFKQNERVGSNKQTHKPATDKKLPNKSIKRAISSWCRRQNRHKNGVQTLSCDHQ